MGELGQKRDRLTGAKADAALMGLSLEGWDEGDDDGEGVWPENAAALRAFMVVCTQFRMVAPGDGSVRRTGLDHTAADVSLRNAGVTVTPELWHDILTIEVGVLTAPHDGG